MAERQMTVYPAGVARGQNTTGAEFLQGKVQPQATSLEEAVLGALMLDKDAISTILDILKVDSFYKDANNKTISEEQAKALKATGQDFKKLSTLRYFHVFNVADIEGVEFKIPEVELKENEQIERCESIIKDMPNRPEIQFNNANEAYYNALQDFINMPDIKQFTNSAEYYVTLFHETIHATGHKDRLNRKGITVPNKFGSIPYSQEELVAEMGAAFLSAEAGINYSEIVENNAAYLQGWLKKLKEDKRFIFRTAAKAQQAARYILGNNMN